MDGDACVEFLRRDGIETLRLYKNYRALIQGAVAGDVRMFCLDDYPANYYLYQEKAQNAFRKAFQLYEGKFHRAVREGQTEILALVERGAAAISPAEDQALRDKWMPPNPVERERIVQVGAAVLGGIGLLAAVLLAWVLSLRGAVRRQTATLQATQVALQERIKEQQCLHAVFRATEDLAAALPDVLRDVATVLPPALLHPDIVVASVEIDGERCSTGNLADADARLEAEIRVAGVRRGAVTVAYTAQRASAQESLFLAEERILVEAVAQRLASTLQRREAEARLREAEARFRSLFESSIEALMLTTDSQFVDCNDATLRLLGVGSKVEFVKLTPADLSPSVQPCGTPSDKRAAEIIEQAFKEGSCRVEVLLKRYDNGNLMPVEITATSLELDKAPTVLITLRDFTERKRYEEQIHRLAFYDALTQLPNRRLLYDRLSQALAHHRRAGMHGCVIYLDLDNFKPLNDLHGHIAGDQLLQEVGQRLVSCLRAQDTVARLGGDEFVALLVELDASWDIARREATHVAEKIRNELARPYVLSFEHDSGAMKTVEHHCTASLGVAIFRPTETNFDNLLRRADDAMYRAKAKGRNQIQFGETWGE